MTDSDSQLETFLGISAALTGFSETELKATGMTGVYFNMVLSSSNPEAVRFFFLKAASLLTHAKHKPGNQETAIATQLMPVSCYDGLAQQIIMLWYTGNWGSTVVSAASYIQGLVWEVGHAHPPGAKQPGYGSWGRLPLSVSQPKQAKTNTDGEHRL